MHSAHRWRLVVGGFAALFAVMVLIGCGGPVAEPTPEAEPTADPEQLSYYIECLDSQSTWSRSFGLSMLKDMGPDAAEALPKLEELREATSGEIRTKVEETIAAIEGG